MTNLLTLPQIPSGTAISIVSGTTWNDQFFVPDIGWPAAPIALIGTLTAGSPNLTGLTSSTAVLVTGMPLSGYGVPPGATILTITDANNLVMSANATKNATLANVTAFPPPLDLTGISFRSQIRLAPNDANVLLEASTANLMMTNSGAAGLFGWAVPASKSLRAFEAALSASAPLACTMDILAADLSGAVIDMGPVTVNVAQPVTR